MTTLNLPVISRSSVSSCVFSLVPNTQFFESPLNKSVQTGELPGARWHCTFTWRNLTDADARIVKAWINSLRGMAGRFYLYDFTHDRPDGTMQSAGSVMGANQAGRTLNIDGVTPGKTLIPGDYFGVNGELKVVTALATANGSGQMAVTFEPPLRTSPADNATVTVYRPTCTMRLQDDEQDRFEFEQRNVTSVTISCVEVFA